MSRLMWDQTGEKVYETGVSKGVVYPQASNGVYPNGFSWNGLTTVTESPSGAEAKKNYADNQAYTNITSTEEFAATVEAYTYPNEFGICNGSAEIAPGAKIGQQKRTAFGLAYNSIIGNDTDGIDYGYKIHLIYGGMAAPSEKAYATQSDSTEPTAFSWKLTTTPVSVTGKRPTASMVIDSTNTDPEKLAALETILYGSDSANPRLPLPDEVASILNGVTPSALTLVSSVPADNATDVALDSAVVLTFNNKVSTQAVSVVESVGSEVSGTKSFDAAGKVLTFTPSSVLNASETYLIVVAGVSDIYSQSMATNVIKFTTAAS